MGVLTSLSVAEIKARGSIKDADVTKLRKAFQEDSSITAEEADGLIALNDACPIQDPAWPPCFVELMTDFIVEQVQPFGYINTHKGSWIQERLTRSGSVESKPKLDLLVNVLAKARWIPQSLSVLALLQVQIAIADGEGPLRAGKSLSSGTVYESDVDALLNILVACGGEGTEDISRAEAEVLLAIDALTAGADNHPAWRDLFVTALAAVMMTASGYAQPPRRQLLARDAFGPGSINIENIMSGMSTGDQSPLSRFQPMSREERAIARLTQQKIEIVTREAIPPHDAGWLAAHLSQGDRHTPNVMALLRFMKNEGRGLDRNLLQLLDRIGAAAA